MVERSVQGGMEGARGIEETQWIYAELCWGGMTCMTGRLVSEKSEKLRVLRATGGCKTPKGRKKPLVGIAQTTPPDHLSADQC